MPVVIAYQSLNSNSSSKHGLAATSDQRFTRLAQRNLASLYSKNSGYLQYPDNPSCAPHDAIHGPANLIPVAEGGSVNTGNSKNNLKRKRNDDQGGPPTKIQKSHQRTLSMVEGKARQIYQQAHRDMKERCDLIVYGELDSSHADWTSVSNAAGQTLHNAVDTRACNCFSVHSSSTGSSTSPIAEGKGWCAVKCKGALIVFVHVPNAIAKSPNSAKQFYSAIKTRLLQTQGGGIVDVVIGDTNQSRISFSKEVISGGMDQSFENAGTAKSFQIPGDTWSKGNTVKHGGTNAADDKPYDIAVYNTDTVKSVEVSYISQFSYSQKKAVAYTDHMGILAKVVKK